MENKKIIKGMQKEIKYNGDLTKNNNHNIFVMSKELKKIQENIQFIKEAIIDIYDSLQHDSISPHLRNKISIIENDSTTKNN